jgi:hypothetical protein
MNPRPGHQRTRENGLTLFEVVIVIFGIVLVVALIILYSWVRDLTAKIAGGSTTGTAYVGTYTTSPPPTLTAPVQVVYTVVQKQFQIVGAGEPTIFGTPMPFQGASVTFSLGADTASVNGGRSATVTTDANGNATVTLAPARDGSDSLTVTLTIGTGSFNEDPVPFEVDAP